MNKSELSIRKFSLLCRHPVCTCTYGMRTLPMYKVRVDALPFQPASDYRTSVSGSDAIVAIAHARMCDTYTTARLLEAMPLHPMMP